MESQRVEALRKQGTRKWTPASGQPFVLLIVDELADVIAYQPDNALRKRANLALQSILSQGWAPGVCVIGQLQDPRKQIIDCRHLFPVKIAMRLDEPEQVDMVLGDGVRQRGATAHEMSEDSPAWPGPNSTVTANPNALASGYRQCFQTRYGGWRDPPNVRRVWGQFCNQEQSRWRASSVTCSARPS